MQMPLDLLMRIFLRTEYGSKRMYDGSPRLPNQHLSEVFQEMLKKPWCPYSKIETQYIGIGRRQVSIRTISLLPLIWVFLMEIFMPQTFNFLPALRI